MISDLSANNPCSYARIPCSVKIIPCSVEWGISGQVFEFAQRLGAEIRHMSQILWNSLFFSLLAGNLAMETGSTVTASATTHSLDLAPPA